MTLKYSSHRPDENLDAIQNLEAGGATPLDLDTPLLDAREVV